MVNENKRLYYRWLTDEMESPATSADKDADKEVSGARKRPYHQIAEDLLPDLSGTPCSVIDDEEYLEELVRGGDAILEGDESSETAQNA